MRTLIAEPCRCAWCQRPIVLLEEAETTGEGSYHLDCYAEVKRSAVVEVEEEMRVA